MPDRNVRVVATVAQLCEQGFTESHIRTQLDRERWQKLHRAVIATFSGPLPRWAQLNGVLLAAGDRAALSHHTAAELAKLSHDEKSKIHVTVPWGRRVQPIDGAIVHISRRLDLARHPALQPSQTRVEATVFDLADTAPTCDEAIAWGMRACGRRLTTASRLAAFQKLRGRTRWAAEWRFALADLAAGVESPLELRYLRDVERAHRLPAGQRQAPHARVGGRIYDDVRYADGVVVELDGRVAHSDETSHRDLRRDNHAAERGDLVLHFGWDDVTLRPCVVAAQLALVLARQGWTGRPRACSRPGCVLESQTVV